ncbi:RNA recognition motif containing protein [Coccidioides posadasii C735 delta SOWgp]|uniref:RNA recognition motif containing protein n=1 Tax=Coccidioides posadasii (strain C735) TaxID=222929 RepID=C5PH57_COCP7|nr:RNA recognition motif containing protein [Coccidioides posadasii C735 delta SOWgp]EER23860.1 RNA recognition motif containing protein [Coccidioides posadasii C735 delta SOWgp]|eukprot:XP_003066005.1 RNA recognition motif containing protein [Coccidioides posadasii C735 delta SOWgp]
MSFPPPPGLQQPPRPSSAQPQPHSSLPPRPPSNPYTAPGTSGPSSNAQRPQSHNAFTRFQPRSVAASQPYRPHSPATAAPYSSSGSYPAQIASYNPSYQYSQTQYQQSPQLYQQQTSTYYRQQHQQHQQQQYGGSNYGQSSVSQRNQYPGQDQGPYGYGSGGRGVGRHGDTTMDPETEAQIAQWQSAYMSKDESNQIAASNGKAGLGRRDDASSATGANTGPLGNIQRLQDGSTASTPPSVAQTTSTTPIPGQPNAPNQPGPGKTVMRSGGGQTWTDSTLLEWDPAHFRLFCGNLAGEVTDDSLLKAFSKYPSVQKARVIRDKRTEKSKGYGFVSFSDGEDYFRAAREMQGKYIGSHPVLLRRAMTEIRPVVVGKGGAKGHKKGGNASGSGAGGGKASKAGGKAPDGGIQKKQAKTKGGLRVLG